MAALIGCCTPYGIPASSFDLAHRFSARPSTCSAAANSFLLPVLPLRSACWLHTLSVLWEKANVRHRPIARLRCHGGDLGLGDRMFFQSTIHWERPTNGTYSLHHRSAWLEDVAHHARTVLSGARTLLRIPAAPLSSPQVQWSTMTSSQLHDPQISDHAGSIATRWYRPRYSMQLKWSVLPVRPMRSELPWVL